MQLPAIAAAHRRGYRVIVADANPDAPGAGEADVFEHVDLKDERGMLEAARRHRDGDGLDGVFTAGTDFSATVAFVAEGLGLPGLSYEAAKNASDKQRMRECFQRAGVPHPRFSVMSGDGRRVGGAGLSDLTLPVVVKPVDNMGARGVVRVDEGGRLPEVVSESAAYSRSGRVIVEEFIPGNEYSIDSMVLDGEVVPTGVADRHICFDPYFVEMGHTIPTSLPDAEVRRLVEVFSRGVAALGIDTGVAKGDVFLGPDGPVVGEIAARLSGGYMSGWTFPYSSGVDLTGVAIDQAVGLRPGNLEPTRSHTAAERAFISADGVVEEVRGIEEARSVSGIRDLFLRVERGDRVRFPRNNVEKCGNVIASGETRRAAIEAAEAAVAAVVIRLRPNEPSTHRFLFSPSPPPHRSYPVLEDWAVERFGSARDAAKRLSNTDRPTVGNLRPPDCGNDLSYRSLDRTLEMLSTLAPIMDEGSATPATGLFWLATARAGLQGALYVIDSISSSPDAFRRRLPACRT